MKARLTIQCVFVPGAVQTVCKTERCLMHRGFSPLRRGYAAAALTVVASLTLLGGCLVGDESSDPTPSPDATPTAIATDIPEAANSPAPSEPPRSSITIDTEPGADWPENCQPEQVAGLLEAFTRAFNTGDTVALQAILPDAVNTTRRDTLLATAAIDPVAAADATVALQWFSMPDGDGDVAALHFTEDIVEFVHDRNVDGDTMSLRWIKPVPPSYLPGIVDMGVEATLHTGDGMEIALEGKAGIDCSHERLYLWSVGPA